MGEITNKKRLNFKFWNRERDLKILKQIAISAVILASLIIIRDEVFWQIDSSISENDYSADNNYTEEAVCNVLGIELHGELTTYIPPTSTDEEGFALIDSTASENIVYFIDDAENDKTIKAIILEVDSYGGYPVAGEEIAVALKNAKKPTVALIREGGASAAYMAASGADIIFASANSDVGGIGVTMSYLDYVQQNQKEGLAYVPLSSGKFKDTGDPNKPLSQEEKNLLMRDINIIHKNFVKMVSENRNLDIKKVGELADGSTMLGEMALQNGLIDQIGGMFEVKEYLRKKIGEDVEICW
ncbi:TPA: hypothetical protein DCZ46_01140 [Candidatus Campbellbacteria bacterium]|nr:MAG: signal peptide peptidase SppA, 36K type, protease IV [Candidatus Campbellbacteria bacterium GW2011_OD1_34_28]KKP75310.1 MAG: Signal peptide peptidase SppA, 36K type [Candidatus Campbellbacteria bacterium GW2011_GWD2_35_24]KKP76129.1 MAG: signal peptide peptidase SppA, 36K type, protease IV [Candidatus Campbellbacteria bacterium GW2011_GWC2_35_28]KKP77318.1 MAG: Signal peptide peptidase SppA, 36K type [Candidatus Campbellbacteria bacterium GW2011_GWC1_35_31]KKP79247.1 MAG: Signal peptide